MTDRGDTAAPMAQLPLAIALDDSSTLDNFFPAAHTRALLAALRDGSMEPLQYLHGGASAGKSHLLQGLCRRSGPTALYLPLAELADYDPAGLLEGLEATCALLALDGLEAVAGAPHWEEALFHLVNRCRSAGCPLWFAARMPVADLAVNLADLRSRLAGGLVWALPPYSDDEKREILRFRAERRGLHLSEAVIDYLDNRSSRALDAQLAVLERLDTASLQTQRPLTVPLLREVLNG